MGCVGGGVSAQGLGSWMPGFFLLWEGRGGWQSEGTGTSSPRWEENPGVYESRHLDAWVPSDTWQGWTL